MNIGLPWFDNLPTERKIYLLDLADKLERDETKQKIKAINYYYRVIEPRKIKEDIKNGTIKRRKRSKANHDNLKMRLEVVELHGIICHICNKPIHYTDFSIDHIIPISKGGTQDLDNLVPAHKVCNSQKGNKILIKEVNFDKKITA